MSYIAKRAYLDDWDAVKTYEGSEKATLGEMLRSVDTQISWVREQGYHVVRGNREYLCFHPYGLERDFVFWIEEQQP